MSADKYSEKSGIQEMHFVFPSSLKNLTDVEKISEQIGREMALSEDEKDNLAIAMTEAVGNAIVHGNKKDPKKEVKIDIQIKNKRKLFVSVTDEGHGFDPDGLIDPTHPDHLMNEHGRGIFILKALMNDVLFSFSPQGTTLTFHMIKK